MKKLNYLLIVLLAGLVLTGCDTISNKTVHGTGDVESMEVEVAAFDAVNVIGTCNVDIQIGEPQSVKFYAQSEVLDVMTYEVSDGMLQIGFRKNYTVNTSEEIRAEITIPSVSFTGITGAADFELSGEQQDALDIYITGTGNVEAFDMQVDDCNITISGVGNCEVNVITSLDVVVSGVGNIWYMGNPTLSTDISGVGNVTAVDP